MQIAAPAHFLPAVLAVIGLACSSAGAQAQWSAGASAEAAHNDNVDRSPIQEYVTGDQSLDLGLWRAYHSQLADFTALDLQGSVARQQFRRYGGLSNTRVNASATLSHKFGIGDEVPVLSFNSSIERRLFNDENRDQWRYLLGATLRQRVSEPWLLSLVATYERQDGDSNQPRTLPPPFQPKPGNVWDLHGWQLAFNAEWDIGPTYWLAASLIWRKGDIVASVPPFYPNVLIQSTAVSLDRVFGDDFVAYRLSAIGRSLSLDWNWALNDSSTLYFGAERQLSHGSNGLDYQTSIFRTGLLYNF